MEATNLTTVDLTGIALTLANAHHEARDPSSAQTGAHKPYIVTTDDDGEENIRSLEHLLSHPTRKTGERHFADAASFASYFKTHKTAQTELFGTLEKGKFLAVFDGDSKDLAGWAEHTAAYACPKSREWNIWLRANKESMRQEQFAQFIEDNLPDIIEPTGADMLEISRSLEAKKKVNFKSGIRLSNGELELAYEETIEGTSAKGKLKIPESFFIAIPVLTGGEPYRLEARLRYRISDGAQLTMWYDLVRPHKSFEDAVQAAWLQIQNDTGVEILHVE